MNKILIEAKSKETPECCFLKAVLDTMFICGDIEFICMDGIGNLFTEPVKNQIRQAQLDEEQIIILADADTKAKGYGYNKRKEEIETRLIKEVGPVPYFLYPDNHSDGDIECLMESAVQRKLHSAFFDCYEDYEKCIQGEKNSLGEARYNVPSLKNKLHTYMAAQKLHRKEREKFRIGEWLFENREYWNLEVEELNPLKEFFKMNLIK